uniref:Uncharacterized protein n=1 Tax=Bracon brevicornis TaxID=1563983 RepID=A0A6V7L937_9HYME
MLVRSWKNIDTELLRQDFRQADQKLLNEPDADINSKVDKLLGLLTRSVDSKASLRRIVPAAKDNLGVDDQVKSLIKQGNKLHPAAHRSGSAEAWLLPEFSGSAEGAHQKACGRHHLGEVESGEWHSVVVEGNG